MSLCVYQLLRMLGPEAHRNLTLHLLWEPWLSGHKLSVHLDFTEHSYDT